MISDDQLLCNKPQKLDLKKQKTKKKQKQKKTGLAIHYSQMFINLVQIQTHIFTYILPDFPDYKNHYISSNVLRLFTIIVCLCSRLVWHLTSELSNLFDSVLVLGVWLTHFLCTRHFQCGAESITAVRTYVRTSNLSCPSRPYVQKWFPFDIYWKD